MNTPSNNEQFERYSRELMRMYRQQQEGNQAMGSNVSDKSIAPEQNANVAKVMNMDLNQQQEEQPFELENESTSEMPQSDQPQQMSEQELPPWLSDIPANLMTDMQAALNTSPESSSQEDQSISCLKDHDDDSVWDNFDANNPDNGFIKAQVFSGRFAIPINGAEVRISKTIDGETRVFHTATTDESGMTVALPVPTPAQSASLTPTGARPYQTYTLEVHKDGYRTVIKENLPVFPGVVSMQPVQLQPDLGSNTPSSPDVQVEPGSSL